MVRAEVEAHEQGRLREAGHMAIELVRYRNMLLKDILKEYSRVGAWFTCFSLFRCHS